MTLLETAAPKTQRKGKAATAPGKVNQALYDAAILRQVNLLTYREGLVRRTSEALRKHDGPWLERIAGLLSRMTAKDAARLGTAVRLNLATQRTKALQLALDEFGHSSRSVAREALREMRELAFDEAVFWTDLIRHHTAEQGLTIRMPTKGEVSSAWSTALVLGESIRDMVDRWGPLRAELVGRVIRTQYQTGVEAGAVMKGLEGKSGLLAKTADGIPTGLGNKIRTAVSGSVHAGQSATIGNGWTDDLVWISVLDSRTTPTCWANHGKLVNGQLNGLLPPAHVRCRSGTMPYNGDAGKVPQREEARGWMARQDAETQQKVMGPKRFELYKTGRYKWPEDFISDRGKLWKLDDLKKKD